MSIKEKDKCLKLDQRRKFYHKAHQNHGLTSPLFPKTIAFTRCKLRYTPKPPQIISLATKQVLLLLRRAKELADKGFYFLKYSNKGAKISDVWDIIPEDTQGRRYHYAPYPEDLVKNPIALTCPLGGIVLDPFVGTGTTCKVAYDMGRKSVGIDLAHTYLQLANERCPPKNQ